MAIDVIDPKALRKLAQETNFQIPRLEKVMRLTGFLEELSRDPDLGEHLVLKGGTALNVYHLDIPRLSVDADLNLLEAVAPEDLDDRKKEVEDGLERIATFMGYKLDRFQDSHALRGYYMRYHSPLGNDDLIKLDINFLERVSVLPPVKLRPPEWLPVTEPIRVLALDELAGSKIATLMIRGAARDLFDVAQFNRIKLDLDLVRRIAVFHGFCHDLELEGFDLETHTRITPTDLKHDLLNLLPKRSVLTRLKSAEALAHLREDAEKAMTGILPLDSDGLACQRQLRLGNWNPATLFFPHEFNEGLTRHPGMMWRLENAKDRVK